MADQTADRIIAKVYGHMLPKPEPSAEGPQPFMGNVKKEPAPWEIRRGI